MAFELLDHVIFFGMLIVSAGIGLYCRLTGGRQKTNDEFLLAGQKQNPICVAISLMASFMSAISIVSGAAEHYNYGTHFFTINVGNSLGIVLALVLFIPTFYNLKTVSVFQYLELRFGSATRLCASVLTTVQMLLYISIALVAPAISLQTITTLSGEWSVLSCGFVCLFYAALGGMKAIILTDVFQSVFMFASMFAVIFSGYARVGSFAKIFNIASERRRIDIANFSPDLTIRHSWWSTVIGGMVSSLYLNGINQTQVQRYMTMKNYKTVVIAALYSAPIVTALSFCVCVCGLTVFAVYADCDPISSGKIPSGDHILPYYVNNEVHGYGLSGIFAAGVISASLSTVSPVLNSLAAVTVEDYMMPLMKYFHYTKVEPKSSFFAQIFTLVYGIACILISLVALRVSSLLQAALMVFQLVGGPMLGIFSLGLFTSTASQKGTLIGFFTGLISVAWLCLARKPKLQALPMSVANCSANDSFQKTIMMNATTHLLLGNETSVDYTSLTSEFPYITRISYLYYGVIGFLITFVLGYILSCVFRENQSINVNLLHKAVAKPLMKKQSSSINLQPLAIDTEASRLRISSIRIVEP